ncbi:SKP1-like protein 11 [Typha angustifolia]|uniref:SKP1-like protein 11 n=1 Tax=Typha angustifolia TaxID=59011 RepID=UPI003C2E4982
MDMEDGTVQGRENSLEDTEMLELPKDPAEVKASEFIKGESSKEIPVESQQPELPENVVLQSQEKEEFIIKLAIGQQSEIIKNAILDGCGENPVPLLNVSAPILAKAIEFWKRHIDAAEGEDLTEWDRAFLGDLSQEVLFDLAAAANYMESKSLLDCTCKFIADIIKEMKVEEVRDYFGIECDFTEEEERKMREDNAWAFEQ